MIIKICDYISESLRRAHWANITDYKASAYGRWCHIIIMCLEWFSHSAMWSTITYHNCNQILVIPIMQLL